jgi:predicted ribosome quality control (RQC) complex YloA/Tae2 family protein
MQFDALTLAAVADELRATIVGGRVQRVVQTSPLSLGFEVYAGRRRHYLLASAHPQFARVHLVSAKPSRGVDGGTPLLLLLRKYVLGGFIVAVEQPPLERILVISIAKESGARNSGRDDAADADEEDLPLDDEPPVGYTPSPDALRCELIIEPMDRRSNIMLVDDNNVVLECIKRVTRRMSSRVMLPHSVYELPPAQREKRDPRAATAAGIEVLREGRERDLARALVAAYRGVSPQLAREVVLRALDRASARVDEELPFYTIAGRLRELWGGEWQPSLVPGDPEPLSFAPYRQTASPDAVDVPSISAALEAFYGARESLTAHTQRRDALAGRLAAAHEKLDRQRRQLQSELDRARELDQLRWEGEMIFAYMHTLAPRQAQLVVEGQVIQLDPLRSPVDEAQSRFRAYDKAKSAIAGVPQRLATVEARLGGIDELQALLALTDSYEQIEQIAAEGEELGYLAPDTGERRPKRAAGAARPRPLHLVSSDGFDIYVGRSSAQNAEVTFRLGRPTDWWLHVRGIPSAHVIVRGEGREVPERTLAEAGGLAAYFSKQRDEVAAEVELCRRSVVRRIPGGSPSLVTYRAERTLRVAPRAPW